MTEENRVVLSDEQARIIASAIFPDIKKYIEEHQEEFQRWLKEQKRVSK